MGDDDRLGDGLAGRDGDDRRVDGEGPVQLGEDVGRSTMTEPRRSAAAPRFDAALGAGAVVATALGEKRSRSSSSIRL